MGVGETHMQDSLKCQEKTSAWSQWENKVQINIIQIVLIASLSAKVCSLTNYIQMAT